jgi:1-acyl-sn-glycerol-3-phosphate acyltransferase
MRRDRRRERMGPWFLLGVGLLKPPTALLSRRVSSGVQLVPPGGVVLAANHISLADPVVLCDFVLYDLRRVPRFLAKRELFVGSGLVARVMRGAGQIPVDRDRPDAPRALDDAVAALAGGETVVIYPEGTVTQDPGKWPMQARTGVARLALLSGAPVVPVAQWGAQDILDTTPTGGRRGRRLSLRPRRPVRFRVGPPVDLTRWTGSEPTAEVLREVTTAVMDAITAELEVLRGERAPARRYDPRRSRDERRTA